MIQRFFVKPEFLSDDAFSITDEKIIHQITRVMRMSAEDKIILLDGFGAEYECEIKHVEKESISGDVIKKSINSAEPKKTVILYQAMPKKMELFEMVLQKGTEIGVKKFVPLITERTERRSLSKPERLHAILQEAAEQSGRGIIPELLPPVRFHEIIPKNLEGKKIVFDSSGITLIKNEKETLSEFHLFVGPEGGFSKSEIDFARKTGVSVVSFGKLTLRTETAGILAPGIILYETL